MFFFKACPKCSGDVHFEQDFYGSYFKCIQCGRTVDMEVQEPGVDKKPARRTAKVAA